MVNHTRYEHQYTVVIITWLIILGMNTILSGYNCMVNHTRYEHRYTVVLITWLTIQGMDTIIQWL
jgi:hypothetical protein